jgi:hypothetical protein
MIGEWRRQKIREAGAKTVKEVLRVRECGRAVALQLLAEGEITDPDGLVVDGKISQKAYERVALHPDPCPHCGRPYPAQFKSSLGRRL